MALHRLTSVVIGVPCVAESIAFYAEFGLTPTRPGRLATADGGEQLVVEHSASRRLVEIGFGVDDSDDLDRAATGLSSLGIVVRRDDGSLRAREPASSVAVVLEVAPRLVQEPSAESASNAPGRVGRANGRAAGVERTEPVMPRKLGHVVFGSPDQERSERFFTAGLGMAVSDVVPGLATFLRCSSDHHNVLVQQSPVPYLHHTSWQVDDVDEVGRGATAMLSVDPSRQVWGLGRHHIGSNFFWYLKDPAGNYCEYYSDLDVIDDAAAWRPQVWEGDRGLYSWGPAPPACFLEPVDLPDLVVSQTANVASLQAHRDR